MSDYIFNYTYYNTYTRVMNLYDVSQGLSYLWVLHACVYPVWQRENLTIVLQRLRQGMLLARCQDRNTCEFQGKRPWGHQFLARFCPLSQPQNGHSSNDQS